MGRRAPPKSRPLRAGRSLNAVARPGRPGEPGDAAPGGEVTSAGLISIGKRARLNPVSDPRPLEKCREEVRRIELRTGVLGKIGEKQEVVVFKGRAEGTSGLPPSRRDHMEGHVAQRTQHFGYASLRCMTEQKTQGIKSHV